MFTAPVVVPGMWSSNNHHHHHHDDNDRSAPRGGRLRRLSFLQSKSSNIISRSISQSPSRASRRSTVHFRAASPDNSNNTLRNFSRPIDASANNNNNTTRTHENDDDTSDSHSTSSSRSNSRERRERERERRRRTVWNPSFAPVIAPAHSRASSHDALPTLVASGDGPESAASNAVAHQEPSMTRTRAATTGEATAAAPNGNPEAVVPSIRFSAYYDTRSTRPSLTFSPISRTLPTGSETIRVGRYSERDSQTSGNAPGNQPSAAPVGFKSKVVSRRHCEFWYEDGKWYIKDVKSSSGTFLNHIRLSPPSQESKAFPINDGDIVQLGIDFKGGEEMIFRCVKMRVELNRGWQTKANSFNTNALKNLRSLTKTAPGATGNSQDCSICLNRISPCQSLFVAPCSHTWHFKCVRALLFSPHYPAFSCPNCRGSADLEADVDEPSGDWEQLDEESEEIEDQQATNGEETSAVRNEAEAEADLGVQLEQPNTSSAKIPDTTVEQAEQSAPAGSSAAPPCPSVPPPSAPMPIKNGNPGSGNLRDPRTPSPPGYGPEGPITPRNDAGPWVFDGNDGDGADAADATVIIRSIDAAADVSGPNDTSSR